VGERSGGKGGGVFPPLCQVSISECSAHFLQYFHLLLKTVKGERASVLKFTIFVREKWSGDTLNNNILFSKHKVLTYIEYRAVSDVFRTIDPLPPLHPASVSSPPPQRRGDTHSPGDKGVGGQYFGRRQTLDWPLTVLSPYDSKCCRLYN
jgi:hypothetical protein